MIFFLMLVKVIGEKHFMWDILFVKLLEYTWDMIHMTIAIRILINV